MPFFEALAWIKDHVRVKGGNWWDLFNPPATPFVPAPIPAPRPTQPAFTASGNGSISFPIPNRVSTPPNSISEFTLSATITTNSNGQSIMSFTIPTGVPVVPSGVVASVPASSSAWPFGKIQNIEGIVAAVEVGVGGVTLRGWNGQTNSLTQKKCNYMVCYNYYKSTLIGSDVGRWVQVFESSVGIDRHCASN
jgi:intracellular sulfur oxidation DsrE/DsrF family protein